MTRYTAEVKRREDGSPRLGPNGRPMRSLLRADTLAGKLWLVRWLLLRRFTQLLTLLLFFGTAHWGWSVAGQPVLTGNLSSSKFLGFLPMADPFATLQIFLTGHVLSREVVIGAVIILLFYALIGGRTFCAWVCPVNMVTDLAGWLRNRLGVPDLFRLYRSTRYIVLAVALVLSAVIGVAAFEWVSPIAILHRGIIFGLGIGWTAILGLFLFDLLILKHGWCGHLCPLGAFYALAGRPAAQLRVRFDDEPCTRCGECTTVCPEPQVLNLKKAARNGMVASGECTNCGRCTPVCAEKALAFDLRYRIPKHSESR